MKAICPEGLAPCKEGRLDLNDLFLGHLLTQALIQKPSCATVLHSVSTAEQSLSVSDSLVLGE